MSTITYYFNSYIPAEAWTTHPEYMVDGNTNTYAGWETVNGKVQLLNTNTCTGTNLGTITKVEIRLWGMITSGVSSFSLRPVFGGTLDGDVHNTGPMLVGTWSSYFNITSDTNAPATWNWSDIQNLNCDVIAVVVDGVVGASKIEIQVTYTDGPAPQPTPTRTATARALIYHSRVS